MDWKEEIVLRFRTLIIDKNIISKSMQNFVESFNRNLDKYKIEDIAATTDSYNYINIKGYKRIEVRYSDNEVIFSSYDENKNEDIVFIKLSIVKELGHYLIEYVNAENIEPKLEPFINEDIIDEIFKDLFVLNKKVVHLNR